MKKIKQLFIKLMFLIMLFLVDFTYYLYLFTLPIIILVKYQSLSLVAGELLLAGLGKLVAPLLATKVIKSKQPRLYYVLGFAFMFISIIVINKVFAAETLLVSMFFWALAYNLIKIAGELHAKSAPTSLMSGTAFLHRPIRAAALILAPVFGTTLVFVSANTDYVGFLGVLSAIAALIYMIFFNKISRKEINLSVLGNVKIAKKLAEINKTTVITGFIQGYFWVFAPLAMYLEFDQFRAITWVLIWLNAPYLLLLIWKNIFKMRVWQLKPIVKYILFVICLIPFFFKLDTIFFMVAVVALGIVLALVQTSDAQESNYKEGFVLHQFNYGLGFCFAMLFGMFSINNAMFGTGLGFLGIIILLYVFVSLIINHRK